MTTIKGPFETLRKTLLAHLAAGHCVGIKGLSNSGKSLLMRALAEPASAEEYKKIAKHNGYLVYIDCNRAVAISAQAFYEVVLRSILEALVNKIPSMVASNLRQYHQTITEADNAFTASLSFNLALSELCEQIDGRLCLLFDEFGEIYAALDDRALLNLRALRDRFREHLAYASATWRSMPELRGDDVEDEFAELFSRFTYPMPLLEAAEAVDFLDGLKLALLNEGLKAEALHLSGGHPGMLVGIAQVLTHIPDEWKKQPESFVRLEPQPRAECMKLWDQLNQDERAALIALVLDPKSGLPRQQNRHLHSLGLLRDDQIFSPIFADFVGRKGRGSEIDSQGVYLDVDSGDVWVDGVRVPVLTDLEYRLLELLYERRDKLTDKYQIVTAVWGEEYLGSVDDARVEKLISRLRGKIEPEPANPRYLITRRGRGYKLLTDATEVKS
jgi:DNA-binding winged helix-turn-helix (wHTH) protein/energy-coupling factor transporter ATP-binding protein EcfA2